ncbi:CAP-associated domain-containing protein [Pseudalkalibacillus hwajinpoensis]|uniref:CAP domain-containing protein n=1 Tax=Guptibacillus hwajinpoensis TaxID=208199 RepID=UPI00325AEF33
MIKNVLRFIILIALVIVSMNVYERIEWNQVLPEVERIITEEDFVLDETAEEKATETVVEEKNLPPLTGVEKWIGESSDAITSNLGKPDRIDPSAYGYDWWIYEESNTGYLQVGIEEGRVVTIFFMGNVVAGENYPMGEQASTVFSDTSPEGEVALSINGDDYRFQLSEEEKQLKPLMAINNGLFAQYYFDKFNGKLRAVRLAEPHVLVKQKPYAVSYRGELIEAEPLSDEEWKSVQAAMEKQIFGMTNVLRQLSNKEVLVYNDEVSEVAIGHSKDMQQNNYFSHTSPSKGELSDRLKKGDVLYSYAGENIAARYPDAGAAMLGWLNSKGHREALLNEEFTDIGVGVYREYYTQNFIKPF